MSHQLRPLGSSSDGAFGEWWPGPDYVAMGLNYWLDLARRGLRRSPRSIALRIVSEVKAEAERVRSPRRAERFRERELLEATASETIRDLWQRLSERPYLNPNPPTVELL